MQGKLVTVFGASGFIGRNIVRELAQKGARVNSVCRDAEKAKFLRTMGVVGQVTPMRADITNPEAVARACEGADMVVNLVGILSEWGRNRFDAIQAKGAGTIAEAAAKAGATRFVHISAIGADAASKSSYARTKAAGEEAVKAAFPSATILRPSIVFGPNDGFFNKFAQMTLISPVLPLIGGGKTRFQPVYVDDVADATMAALTSNESAGKTYELGGPSVFSFRELMELTMKEAMRPRCLVSVPFWAASIKGWFLQKLPAPLLTVDQVELLKSDNVVSEGALGLSDLGVEATPVEIVLPTYLDKFRPGGRYNTGRAAA